MIEQKDVQIGKKFEVIPGPIGEYAIGTVLEVTGFDCDNWPYVKDVVSGRTDCISTRRFLEGVKKYNDVLEGRWIVWNDVGSSYRVNSETEAKAEAERLARIYTMPAYIAQAQNMVQIEQMVWLNN